MYVFLIAAVTIDGFIARNHDEPSTAWTSKEDSRWFHTKTTEAGVVVMGRTSYVTIPEPYRPLKNRLNVVYTSQATDGLEKASDAEWRTNLEPKELLERLTVEGHEQVAIAGGQRVYSDWMRSGLVNTLYITVEPVVFGQGIKLFDSGVSAELELRQAHELSGQTRVLEYVPVLQ